MNQNNISIAESYYLAMAQKNITKMENHLHPNVEFTSPLGHMTGKEVIIEAIKKLFTFFKTLTIRSKFSSNDQAMLVCDYEFSEPIGNVPTAVLMTIQDNLITKIQLFYDARPFDKNR